MFFTDQRTATKRKLGHKFLLREKCKRMEKKKEITSYFQKSKMWENLEGETS